MNQRINHRNGGWGTLLITIGLMAFAENFGFSDWYQVGFLLLGGLVAFLFYYQDQTDQVALIPAYVLWAGALVTAGALSEFLDAGLIAVGVLVLIAIPFLYTYLRDTSKWWALIPSFIMMLIAFVILSTEVLGLGDQFIAVILLPGMAIPFLYVYLKNQEHWWALIPAYVFMLIGLIIALSEFSAFGGKFIAPGILGGIGLPFLYVYLKNRDHWWALIPAYAMLAIGLLVLLLEFRLLTGLVIPAFIMWAVAVPFIYVYILNPENKWALIPGGIMAVMGFGFLLGTDLGKFLFPAALVLAGVWLFARVLKKD